ncbi:ZIP family metal transporter [Telluria beijingensis]|uniref:ZIP family metal transporter n=1 Tax=Telluria beijingensis TaxID=3068633 RepID=UPI0027951F88|nr:ZIP family zinc transporter [Massilia sp. REN29]
MDALPGWLQAGTWGLVAGAALLLGAFIGIRFEVPQRLVAAIMAFGSGVLISALSFELMDEAIETGGFASTAAGFLAGAVVYTAANWMLARRGARHRKRSRRPAGAQDDGNASAIAVGALLDGIPESIVIGLSLLGGQGVSTAVVVAVFLSNLPEGLSSAAGMKQAGRSHVHIYGVWGCIALASGLAALAGYTVFHHLPPEMLAATTAVAAGGVLAMVVDTMIPEAFEETHDFAGLIVVLGFLAAFALSKLG